MTAQRILSERMAELREQKVATRRKLKELSDRYLKLLQLETELTTALRGMKQKHTGEVAPV
jgi:hypothetical protein